MSHGGVVCDLSQKTLHEMYETAIGDKDYSFWYILLTAKKEEMFFIRFEQQLVLA